MAAWRMAMRGTIHPADQSRVYPPIEMWPCCHKLGVAAITYDPVKDDDFAAYNPLNLPNGWAQLTNPQKVSLKRFVYEMQEGDVIYVRESPKIVGKGIVLGGLQIRPGTSNPERPGRAMATSATGKVGRFSGGDDHDRKATRDDTCASDSRRCSAHRANTEPDWYLEMDRQDGRSDGREIAQVEAGRR